jgi:signal peptidase I
MPINDISDQGDKNLVEKKSVKHKLMFSTLPVLSWIFIFLLIVARVFIFQPVEVNGNSMLPTTHQGARWIVEEISSKVQSTKFQRGQIIVFCAETNNCDKDNVFARFSLRYYIKRIVGLPGESIEIKNSKTIIYNKENPNGAVLYEEYLSQEVKDGLDKTTRFDIPLTKIPEDSYFIMGDNRVDSSDSRYFGPVAEKALLGKVWIQFWPLSEAGNFDLPNYQYTKYIPEQNNQ